MDNAISTFTVKQLKEHLRVLGLPISGNKAALIQRLTSAIVSTNIGTSYDKLTVIQLKQLLKERSLSISGNKAALINRIQTYEPAYELAYLSY